MAVKNKNSLYRLIIVIIFVFFVLFTVSYLDVSSHPTFIPSYNYVTEGFDNKTSPTSTPSTMQTNYSTQIYAPGSSIPLNQGPSASCATGKTIPNTKPAIQQITNCSNTACVPMPLLVPGTPLNSTQSACNCMSGYAVMDLSTNTISCF